MIARFFRWLWSLFSGPQPDVVVDDDKDDPDFPDDEETDQYSEFLEAVGQDPHWEDAYWNDPLSLIELADNICDMISENPADATERIVEYVASTTQASIASTELLLEAVVHIFCPEYLDDIYPL